MNHENPPNNWPLWVWILQLLVAGSLSWIFILLVTSANDAGVSKSILIVGIGSLMWLFLGPGVVAMDRGRRWIVDRRRE